MKESKETKKVTILMDAKQKWYLEEVAHASRTSQREVLHYILEAYIKDHPLIGHS